jgi:hypothetical protein
MKMRFAPNGGSIDRSRARQAPARGRRRGAMLVLIAALMIVILGMVAFAVDVSYMQLTQSELRAATDAAAKAGAGTLAREQNETPAMAKAIEVAGKNYVGGHLLQIDSDNVHFGQSQLQADGSWKFVAGVQPYRSVQVSVDMSAGTTPGTVDLFFGRVFGRRTFSPQCTAVASHMDQELCFVIDRSHSMCFDLTGADFHYPSPIGTDSVAGIKSAPIVNSRWKALESAITDFFVVVNANSVAPRVALVTWASDVPAGSYEAELTGQTSPAVAVDVALGSDFAGVEAAVKARGTKPMLGSTNMSAGMDKGKEILTGPTIRPLATKVMVLMTDGLWNTGRNPIDAAQEAKAAGIVIHTITFLPTADQTTMKQIAAMTGGKHFLAADKAALRDAFREIALTLSVALTE